MKNKKSFTIVKFFSLCLPQSVKKCYSINLLIFTAVFKSKSIFRVNEQNFTRLNRFLPAFVMIFAVSCATVPAKTAQYLDNLDVLTGKIVKDSLKQVIYSKKHNVVIVATGPEVLLFDMNLRKHFFSCQSVDKPKFQRGLETFLGIKEIVKLSKNEDLIFCLNQLYTFPAMKPVYIDFDNRQSKENSSDKIADFSADGNSLLIYGRASFSLLEKNKAGEWLQNIEITNRIYDHFGIGNSGDSKFLSFFHMNTLYLMGTHSNPRKNSFATWNSKKGFQEIEVTGFDYSLTNSFSGISVFDITEIGDKIYFFLNRRLFSEPDILAYYDTASNSIEKIEIPTELKKDDQITKIFKEEEKLIVVFVSKDQKQVSRTFEFDHDTKIFNPTNMMKYTGLRKLLLPNGDSFFLGEDYPKIMARNGETIKFESYFWEPSEVKWLKEGIGIAVKFKNHKWEKFDFNRLKFLPLESKDELLTKTGRDNEGNEYSVGPKIWGWFGSLEEVGAMIKGESIIIGDISDRSVYETINIKKTKDSDFIMQSKHGNAGCYYSTARTIKNLKGFIQTWDSIARMDKVRLLSFDEFDLYYNRPDLVLQNVAKAFPALNINNRIKEAENLIKLRTRQLGLNLKDIKLVGKRGLPVHYIVTSFIENNQKNIVTEANYNLKVNFKIKYTPVKIIGYKIYINGVPEKGDFMNRTYPNSGRFLEDNEVTIEETITLSEGENKIEVSAFTEDGAVSTREGFTVTYNPLAKSKPNLYFVGIGIDSYNVSRNGGLDALKYAVKDSKELEETFKKSGKNFAKVHAKVLANAEVTRESISKLKEFLSKSRVDDHVILFLSGHGIRKDTKVSDLITAFGANIPPQYKLLDKSDVDDVYYYMTPDSHVDKPWEKAVPLDAIREIVNGIPSRQKIMLVDTCQSGEKLDLDDATIASLTKNVEIRKTRGKTASTRGVKLVTTPGTKEKPEEVEKHIVQTIVKTNALKEMSELFPELRRGTGTIEISAATGAQSALESSEWKNGAFTFVIKEAILKGKAKDSKGNITARSLRKFVLEEVERLTDGQQTPMVARDISGRDFVIFGKWREVLWDYRGY